jgi:hypothetical protein
VPGRYARAEAHRAERCPQPVRPVPGELLQAMAGDLGGELGAGGDVELGEHVFTRVWQALGSNQRRLSRRFYSTLLPPPPHNH